MANLAEINELAYLLHFVPLNFLIEHFTVLEPLKLSIDVSELQ